MHILSLFKILEFIPDLVLRKKLYCNECEMKKSKTSRSKLCLCLYGLDYKTVDSWVNSKSSRNNYIDSMKLKYFDYNREKEGYEIKGNKRKEIDSITRDKKSKCLLMKHIGMSWGIKIIDN